MNTEIVIALIGILSTVISSGVTFLFTKKKYNAEVDNQVIENLKHSLDFYKTLCEDNSKKLDEYKRENEDLRKRVMDLQDQLLNMSINLCYDATCTARKLQKELEQKNERKNGVDRKKKVEKE